MKNVLNGKSQAWSTRRFWQTFVLAGVLLGAAAACDRGVTAPGAERSDAAAAIGGAIGGTVLTLDGTPIAGAVVSTPSGASAVTGTDGSFTLGGLAPTGRLAVDVAAEGFATTSRIYRVVAGERLSREIRMIPAGPPVVIVAGQGGVVRFSDVGSVEIPANAFAGVSPDEPVTVRVDYWDPADAAAFRTAPGDFSGIEADGTQSVLSSNGMLNVRVTGAQGQLLALAEGQSMRINVPDRATHTATTCSWGLYRYDPAQGRWILVRPVAPPIPGTVTTWVDANGVRWNIDCWIRSTRLPVRVIDAVGNPVRNFSVTASALSYFGGGETWTDANGFATLPLGADQRVSVEAGSASVQVVTPPAGTTGPVVTLVL